MAPGAIAQWLRQRWAMPPASHLALGCALSMSPADRPDVEEVREHAEFNARESDSGIGAAVARAEYRDGHHVWECIVSDGQEWHHIEVIGTDVVGFEELQNDEIEQGIDRFAATLSSSYRLTALQNANPLHINRAGLVTD
jgi:hypothetical protein